MSVARNTTPESTNDGDPLRQESVSQGVPLVGLSKDPGDLGPQGDSRPHGDKRRGSPPDLQRVSMTEYRWAGVVAEGEP